MALLLAERRQSHVFDGWEVRNIYGQFGNRCWRRRKLGPKIYFSFRLKISHV